MSTIQSEVREYYGRILESSDDLKTNACCTDDGLPDYLKPMLAAVHDEVMARYYGCGLIAPPLLEGCNVLDLGSGSGRDCYVLAQMVGEKGTVTGVDMTTEQLEVANRHLDHHRDRFGFAQSNVRFLEGYIEELDQLPIVPGSIDVIVSNCVINLSPDKLAVLQQAYDLLKVGGEMYFSDVYASRRVPEHLRSDKELYGECLAGALYWNDFEHLARKAGFLDPRLVDSRRLTIDNKAIEEKLDGIEFYSATYRLFKLPELEPACEDYGQAVIYKGSVAHHPNRLVLDEHHVIETGKVFPVCGNTWRMLTETRFAEHFEFIGNFDKDYGIFAGCGKLMPFATDTTSPGCC